MYVHITVDVAQLFVAEFLLFLESPRKKNPRICRQSHPEVDQSVSIEQECVLTSLY